MGTLVTSLMILQVALYAWCDTSDVGPECVQDSLLMGMRNHTTGQLGVPSDTGRDGFLGSTAVQGRCSGIK